MVATVRCEEIANEKYSSFAANEVPAVHIVWCFCLQFWLFFLSLILVNIMDHQLPNYFKWPQDWCHLEEAVQSGPIPGFGKKLSSLLDAFLSQ